MSKKQTSPREASKAGEVLGDPQAGKLAKSLAGSALRQVEADAVTSAEMAEKAAKALQSDEAGKDTKSLAGAVLAQAEPASKK